MAHHVSIQACIEQLDVEIGFRATDPDAYVTFGALFDPAIKDYHKIPMNADIRHPSPSFGSVDDLDIKDLDPDGKYVISTRVRVGRNLDGFPFQSLLSDDERAKVETRLKNTFGQLQLVKEYDGEYHSLETMTEAEEKNLIETHLLFNHSNSASRSAGVYRNWPMNRGIYINKTKTFLVWISETDHTRIISMQPGGRIDQVYSRLVEGVRIIEKQLRFAHSDRLGYITFCPTNLGTTLRASVHIKIPKLAANKEVLGKLCDDYNLQVRGIDGDGTGIFGDTFDISNKRRMGLTEIQAVVEMAAGVKAIINEEENL
ncbi:arginine kinase-like [Mercenaria mercenaria]|uniref:arginine kinase-like n=1 Tax=Mercenaria mercenaria TaxID=6596 RepID=UPI00234F7C12|nr:arginine kinase-like [Mercenaria mercenaria]